MESLTLGGAGDLDCIEVTGESSTQIKGSLINAAGAFTGDTDETNINLVAMEVGNASHDDIDIGEAVFGTEEVIYGTNVDQRRCRVNDGFFNDVEFCKKVAGVIITKRKEHLPNCEYTKLLFINDKFRNRVEQIGLIMNFDRVIHFNDLIP